MLKIYSPEGLRGQQPLQLAPAPAALAGLRLAVLDNRKPNARLLLEQVAHGLAQRAGVCVAAVTAKANAAVACNPELLGQLREQADVILTGSAD